MAAQGKGGGRAGSGGGNSSSSSSSSPSAEASGPGGGVNVFANDGSFLELFKRRMEAAAAGGGRSGAEAEKAKEPEPRPEPPEEQEPPGKKRIGSALSFVRDPGTDPPSFPFSSLLFLPPPPPPSAPDPGAFGPVHFHSDDLIEGLPIPLYSGQHSPCSSQARITVAVFYPFTQVGKRRGGSKLALKTGVVAKKQKTEDEVLTSKGDAWAKYMAEVKKYKAHQCSDDDKTRPLVK
ncbi:hypothetical protein JD844_011886 [Phrynosoma platyrhinos]|uniref:Telomerase RNA component interacting RNase n=1 Tax=Phrynosoma platyrhinos TaxID=52577 RepID=A0ABQ7TIP4_PHRPL|nr:hypothetical protein JD844_011886 [Phrynosoma platyrhinos]